jgi:glycosyltransferase involved in cell wall biosynthesis
MNISIVIPFYNEEKNLKILIPKLIKNLNKIKKNRFEVILVDDFSSDKSNYVAKSLCKNSNQAKFKILKLTERGGQTGAFKKAFKIAKGKFIIRMDSDLQDDPKDIAKFITKIESGKDLIIGKRRNRQNLGLLSICSNIYSLLMRFLLISKIHNYSASFVAFNKKYLKKLPWYKNDHRYLPAIVIKRGLTNIAEIDLDHKKRKFGASRYNTFKKIFFGIPEVLLFCIRLKLGFYTIK